MRIVAISQGTEGVIGKGSAFTALVCAIGMAALPAQAWEYARWGMMPAELVAASGGAAKLMAAPEPRNDGKLVAKAEAEARLEMVAVGAEFRFDPASDRLVEIALRAEGKERCVALIERMRERYGLPLSSARFGQISSFRWHDSARSARIIFLSSELAADIRCSATYADAARG